ncbi:MAG: AraC family transcriptional regulator [Anaerolineales bacterium]
MLFDFKTRPSDSNLVETVWQTRTAMQGESFTSAAASHWEMVITRRLDKLTLSIRGPETFASPAPVPNGDVEYFGIVFNREVFLLQLPKQNLVDHEIHLRESLKNRFEFLGKTWEFPTFENADTFVNKLFREGWLGQDQIVKDVLCGHAHELSLRSLQRRFLYVTGLTHKTIQQIDRANLAVSLLQSGVPIPETAYQAGYYDQSHLTRSLKLFAGQTPTEVAQVNLPE